MPCGFLPGSLFNGIPSLPKISTRRFCYRFELFTNRNVTLNGIEPRIRFCHDYPRENSIRPGPDSVGCLALALPRRTNIHQSIAGR